MNQEFCKRNAVAIAALLFLSGIYLCSLLKPGWISLLGSLLLSLLLIYVYRKNKLLILIFIAFSFILSGMLDYRIAEGRRSVLEGKSGKYTEVECEIISSPVVKAFYTQYDVRLKGSREKAFLRVKGSRVYCYGSSIRVYGEVKEIKKGRNPGDFDFARYYKSKGFYMVLEADRVEMAGGRPGASVGAVLHASKAKIRQIIYSALPEEEAVLMYGIISGDKTDMDQEEKDAYAKSGLSHILSVSGLHVGFLMILISFILKPFKLQAKAESIIILAVVFYYIMVIGAPAPALRAFIMLAFMLLARVFKRKYELLPSVSAALFLILLMRPMSIHDPGFVISFSCMYSIALLFEPLNKRLGMVPTIFRGSLALSLAVWLGIMPVLIYYFNYVSVISIAVNLAAIPLPLFISFIKAL